MGSGIFYLRFSFVDLGGNGIDRGSGMSRTFSPTDFRLKSWVVVVIG